MINLLLSFFFSFYLVGLILGFMWPQCGVNEFLSFVLLIIKGDFCIRKLQSFRINYVLLFMVFIKLVSGLFVMR